MKKAPRQGMRFGGGLVLAVLAAGCAPSGRDPVGQLRIETRPEGAEIYCNGQAYGSSPVTIPGLEAGEHLVVAEKAGYRSARRTVALAPGRMQTLRLDLDPLRGLVLVHSIPPEADVSVAGAFRGRTPLLIPDFPLGVHRVRVETEGYLPREVELEVNDRIPRSVSVELVSDAAVLRITSLPPGAEVLLDGVRRGSTPLQIDRVPRGEVTLEMRHAGFQSYRQSLTVRAGETLALDIPLEPLPGVIEVTSQPPGARLYVNEVFRGETPQVLEDLEPGAYRLRAELRGHEPDARTVIVEPASRLSEEFRMARDSGTLWIVTEPAGVEVFVDGESRGVTRPGESGEVSEPLRVDYVPRGRRIIQLTRAGYRHPPVTVRVEPDRIVSLHEKLEQLFIPDTLLILRDGREIRGVFHGESAEGVLEIETRPGISDFIPAERVLERRPIRAP